MTIPSRHIVNDVLQKHGRAAQIYAAVDRGWGTAVEKYPERARWQRKAAFRAIVWEEVIRELSLISADDPTFKPVFHRDTTSFVLDGAILFRFKHADVSLATANYPTAEATAFADHDVDLYGFEGMQRVELCYVLNEFETEIIWTGFAAKSKKQFLWKIELSDAGIVGEAAQLEMFEDDFDPMRIASLRQDKSDEASKDKKKDSGGS